MQSPGVVPAHAQKCPHAKLSQNHTAPPATAMSAARLVSSTGSVREASKAGTTNTARVSREVASISAILHGGRRDGGSRAEVAEAARGHHWIKGRSA